MDRSQILIIRKDELKHLKHKKIERYHRILMDLK